MKLWMIESIEGWKPWYDTAGSFVVRAGDEHAARALASAQCGEEGAKVWLDAKKTECTELTANGEAEVVIRDFARA